MHTSLDPDNLVRAVQNTQRKPCKQTEQRLQRDHLFHPGSGQPASEIFSLRLAKGLIGGDRGHRPSVVDMLLVTIMASNLLAMASTLVVMASNLYIYIVASCYILLLDDTSSNGLEPTCAHPWTTGQTPRTFLASIRARSSRS